MFDRLNFVKVEQTISNEDLKIIEELILNNKIRGELTSLGSGCFGRVYKYVSIDGKSYAIKLSKKYYGGACVPTAYDIETLLELRGNDYILKIYAYDNTSSDDYFVMIVDYVDGVNMADFYNQFQLRDDIVEVFKSTLEYLKSKNIYLDDFHDNNIMIDRVSGVAMIVDFGGLYKVDDEKLEKNSYMYKSKLERIQNLYRYYSYENDKMYA